MSHPGCWKSWSTSSTKFVLLPPETLLGIWIRQPRTQKNPWSAHLHRCRCFWGWHQTYSSFKPNFDQSAETRGSRSSPWQCRGTGWSIDAAYESLSQMIKQAFFNLCKLLLYRWPQSKTESQLDTRTTHKHFGQNWQICWTNCLCKTPLPPRSSPCTRLLQRQAHQLFHRRLRMECSTKNCRALTRRCGVEVPIKL